MDKEISLVIEEQTEDVLDERCGDQERSFERSVNIPVPPNMEKITRFGEQVVVVSVPLILKEIVVVASLVPQEHISERICEQIVEVPVPQVVEQLTAQAKTKSVWNFRML